MTQAVTNSAFYDFWIKKRSGGVWVKCCQSKQLRPRRDGRLVSDEME